MDRTRAVPTTVEGVVSARLMISTLPQRTQWAGTVRHAGSRWVLSGLAERDFLSASVEKLVTDGILRGVPGGAHNPALILFSCFNSFLSTVFAVGVERGW